MEARAKLRKDTDYETHFRCAGGIGILREEVWVNEHDEVMRYNLALILPHLSKVDKGRVLGYDNAHGVHERHYKGKLELISFASYTETAERFYCEAEALRRSYEDQGIR